jgi:hypothetical protein
MRSFRYLLIATLVAVITACAGNAQQEPQLVVAPLGSNALITTEMTRPELEDHVRRFADRHFTRVALATGVVRDKTSSYEIVDLMHKWNTVSQTAVVAVAIGQNAVTNLLDMMTMTRLSRLVVESYWVPEVLGEELGRDFLQTFIDLEDDIWTVADDVLTQQQQGDLRILVDDWHAENPEQYYPWYIRLGNFSGQRAASLAAVQQSGGMLKEVARAREAAEEIQAFGERVLFYLQRAPMITSNEFESGVGDVLNRPQVTRLLNDTDRFVESVDRLVQMVEDLPEERLAIVDQFMDRLANERLAMFQDVSDVEPGLRQVLTDVQPALDSLERIIELSKLKDPDSRPFDVNEYKALVAESAVTAAELRLLVQSATALLAGISDARPLVDAIVEAEKTVGDRVFYQLVALIFIFFITLLIYRVVGSRVLRK